MEPPKGGVSPSGGLGHRSRRIYASRACHALSGLSSLRPASLRPIASVSPCRLVSPSLAAHAASRAAERRHPGPRHAKRGTCSRASRFVGACPACRYRCLQHAPFVSSLMRRVPNKSDRAALRSSLRLACPRGPLSPKGEGRPAASSPRVSARPKFHPYPFGGPRTHAGRACVRIRHTRARARACVPAHAELARAAGDAARPACTHKHAQTSTPRMPHEPAGKHARARPMRE